MIYLYLQEKINALYTIHIKRFDKTDSIHILFVALYLILLIMILIIILFHIL